MTTTRKAYRVAEAAQQLSISPRVAYELIKRGELGTVRVGAEMRVTEAQLAAFVRAREREAEQVASPRRRRGTLRAVPSH